MSRRRKWIVTLLATSAVTFAIAVPYLIDALGGAFTRRPDELAKHLSADAHALVKSAFEGIEPDQMLDYHTHLVGLGENGSGCFVHPGMLSWWSVTRRVRFEVYRSAAGITDLHRADSQYVARLADLIDHIPGGGRYLLLGFDKHYTPDGSALLDETEFYTPNEYVFRICEQHPDRFAAAISVHPYRTDAVEALERWAKRGARIVKWLPNAMGMDPSDPRCDAYYDAMKKHGMVLLTHSGEEQAVPSQEAQRLGNPLLLRRPLDRGVKVVVAHGASLGQSVDLDDATRPERSNFDLFMRLMDEQRYQGLLFGEISATTQRNRLPRPFRTLLTRTDLHGRLVNGSDYPLPAVNVVISTGMLVSEGFISAEERDLLNEIYDFNPLLFDFVLKRTVRGPGGERFAPSVFTEHPALRASR